VQIRTTVQNKGMVKSISKNDEITLEIPQLNSPSVFIGVKVTKVATNTQRCHSCNCILHSKNDQFKFGKATYCEYCVGRKKERMREIAMIGVKKRK